MAGSGACEAWIPSYPTAPEVTHPGPRAPRLSSV